MPLRCAIAHAVEQGQLNGGRPPDCMRELAGFGRSPNADLIVTGSAER